MKRLASAVAVPLLVATAACGGQDTSSAQEGALIGGQPAGDAFPSTVLMVKSRCTAALVGPRHLLTAAHCVLDAATARLKARFEPQGTFALKVGANDERTVVVAETHVSPSWASACAKSYCASSAVTTRLDAADVALVELQDPVGGVPVAAVDVSDVAVGMTVQILGYGCEEGLWAGDDRETVTLATASTVVITSEEAVHDGSYVGVEHLEAVEGNYLLTPGPAHDPPGAGLCPGDSGGPVYRELDGQLAVVGVNTNYTLGPEEHDNVGLPVTNWHTRLGEGSRHGIAEWLAEHGAQLHSAGVWSD